MKIIAALKHCSLLLLLTFTGCDKWRHFVGTDDTSTPTTTKTFLVMGQSNMRGGPGGAFDPVDGVTGVPPASFGPAFIFGTIMRQEENRKVVLLNCDGYGSSIADFMPGGRAYQTCMDMLRGQTVTAILYWQGEAESQLPYLYPWAQNFHQLIDLYKQVTGNVPVIYCQLGITTDYTEFPNFDHIKTEQAMAQTAGFYMVTTDTVPNPLVDSVHFNHMAVQEVGRRIYQAYQGIEPK